MSVIRFIGSLPCDPFEPLELPAAPLLAEGTRVRLTREAIAYYRGFPIGPEEDPVYIPKGQGGGSLGTIIQAGGRKHSPGADARPYFVAWENGATNSYREQDLEAAP